MTELENKVAATLRNKPAAIGNNDVLWVELVKALCNEMNITSIDDMLLKVLEGKIPTSHSTAAALTNVRVQCPELRPTEEQKKLKKDKKDEYIQAYRNL